MDRIAMAPGLRRWSAIGVGLGLLLAAPFGAAGQTADEGEWTETFFIEECTWASSGSNPYFVLEPGYELFFTGEEDGEALELTITVLDETKTVDGVETRVVEERETADGELVEVSRNFFAICAENGGVFYFGEEVDDYEEGKVSGHDGAWLAGVDGAKAGLIMPGLPLVGARYYQEIAPEVALDRAEVVSLTETVETPAGTFQDCLKTEETTPLEPDVTEEKFYARGIGLIQDAGLTLVRSGQVEGA